MKLAYLIQYFFLGVCVRGVGGGGGVIYRNHKNGILKPHLAINDENLTGMRRGVRVGRGGVR